MRSTTPVRGFRRGKQTTTESDRPPEWTVCYLSKHAGSDPEALGLWPVYGHYGQRAARFGPDSIIMLDLTSHICFSSIFPKKAWIILCKTDPDPIWMAWPGFGQMPLVWKQAGEQDSSGPVSGRTQLACYPHTTISGYSGLECPTVTGYSRYPAVTGDWVLWVPCSNWVQCVPYNNWVMSVPCSDWLMSVPCSDWVMSVPCSVWVMSVPCSDWLMLVPCSDWVMSVLCSDWVMSVPYNNWVMSVPCGDWVRSVRCNDWVMSVNCNDWVMSVPCGDWVHWGVTDRGSKSVDAARKATRNTHFRSG